MERFKRRENSSFRAPMRPAGTLKVRARPASTKKHILRFPRLPTYSRGSKRPLSEIHYIVETSLK